MNTPAAQSKPGSSYTVVLRCAESQLRIPVGRGILLAPITSDHGNYELRIATRTDNVSGISTPIPRELWIEVTGPAPSLEIALNIAAATTNDYVRQLAFAANAWHGLLNIHLAYESTRGCRDRAFFQNWVIDERGLPRAARLIDPDLMFRLLAAVTQLGDKDRSRVIRAITQYTDALQHWKVGGELYALAHLYMGVEAITPTAIRWEMQRRGVKRRRDFEAAVLHPPKASFWLRAARWAYVRAGGKVRPPNLDAWARRELIFRGDYETFRTAKTASDNLEHGLAQHDEVHQMATRCVGKCAEYLRHALLDFIPITEQDRAALKAKPYTTPASTGGFERQLLATITCDHEDIAAPEQAYPFVRWEFDLKDYRLLEDGTQEMQLTQKITPIIREDARMQLTKIAFSGPSETTRGSIEVTVSKKEREMSAAGVDLAVDEPANAKWINPIGSFILNCNAVRYLSVYWVIRLTGQRPNEIPRVALSHLVETILSSLSLRDITKQLQDDCDAAWKEAVAFDEVRAMLAGCTAQPVGLLAVDDWQHGQGPVISDIAKLVQMNDKIVELGKRLTALLDQVLAIPPRANRR